MKSIYVAVVGLNNYFGAKIFKPGQILRLIKDYDNDYDAEAIVAVLSLSGKWDMLLTAHIQFLWMLECREVIRYL